MFTVRRIVQGEGVLVHLPAGGAVGLRIGREDVGEAIAGALHLGARPGRVRRGDAVLPADVVPRVDAGLEAGAQSGLQVKAYRRSVEERDALVALGDDLLRKHVEYGLELLREVRERDYFFMGSFAYFGVLIALGLGALYRGIADSLADAYGVERASNDPQTFALLTAVCGCHAGKA